MRTFPVPVSHLEASLYEQLKLADMEVLSALQLVTRSTSLALHDEYDRIKRNLPRLFIFCINIVLSAYALISNANV